MCKVYQWLIIAEKRRARMFNMLIRNTPELVIGQLLPFLGRTIDSEYEVPGPPKSFCPANHSVV